MNSMVKFSFQGSKVILNTPLIRIPTIQELQKLPNDRARFLSLYRRFYKLRNIIARSRWKKETYLRVLQRSFRHIDFNTRRKVFLNEQPEQDILERMVNTLAFVFNSTVASESEMEPKEVMFFEDLNIDKRIEKSIILTILTMDTQKPNAIKYDFKYEWVKEVDDFLTTRPNSKKSSKLTWIGFKQYELNLMRLNESYKLCL